MDTLRTLRSCGNWKILSSCSLTFVKFFFVCFFFPNLAPHEKNFGEIFFLFPHFFFFFKRRSSLRDTPSAQHGAIQLHFFCFLKYIVMSTLYIQPERKPIRIEMWKLTIFIFNQWPSKDEVFSRHGGGKRQHQTNVYISEVLNAQRVSAGCRRLHQR